MKEAFTSQFKTNFVSGLFNIKNRNKLTKFYLKINCRLVHHKKLHGNKQPLLRCHQYVLKNESLKSQKWRQTKITIVNRIKNRKKADGMLKIANILIIRKNDFVSI